MKDPSAILNIVLSTTDVPVISFRPIDNVEFQVLFGDVLFRNHFAQNGDIVIMHACPVARDKRMPMQEVLALRNQAVGAGRRHPFQRGNVFGRENHTSRDFLFAIVIVNAAAALMIEQLAGHIRIIEVAGVFVFQLQKTTFGAAVTEGFPFGLGHLAQCFFPPKWPLCHLVPSHGDRCPIDAVKTAYPGRR